MEARKGKLGVNTLFLIFITIIFSPISRLYLNYTTEKAGQAAWLSPIPAAIILFYLLMKLNTLLVNHPGLSLMEIYEKITGKFSAKIISAIYLIWILIILGVNLSATSFRLTSALYPNIDDNVFILALLVLIFGLFIPAGVVIASRMFKIFFWMMFLGLWLLIALIAPNMELNQIMPISYLDIIPVLDASKVILFIWTYITIMLIWSDDLIGLKEFKKRSKNLTVFLLIGATSFVAISIGAIGHHVLSNTVYPLLTVVEDIMLLESIQGFDAILVVIWTFSDIALITCLSFSCLKLIKYIFNLKDTSMYINLFGILTFYVTLIMNKSQFELANVQMDNIYYFSIFLFAGIPIIMAWIYKLRSKATKALLKSQNNS